MDDQRPGLILASGSPRRSLLLSAAGFTFDVVRPDVDETPLRREEPGAMVLRLSEAKAASAVNRTTEVVLAADTTVVRDGEMLGKPQDHTDAVNMLMSLQGRAHSVLTGWTVVGDSLEFGIAETRVHFRSRSMSELSGYVTKTDPMDKAGAYGIQGDDGWLIERVVGSRANVMGLPIGEIAPVLLDMGVERSST
jgi:septum formation protein